MIEYDSKHLTATINALLGFVQLNKEEQTEFIDLCDNVLLSMHCNESEHEDVRKIAGDAAVFFTTLKDSYQKMSQ